MSIKTPAELAAEFKKSGEFDRLRRELLHKFRGGDDINAFTTRVNDIGVGNGSVEENKRSYPLVQRAVANVPAFSDQAFQSNVRKSLSQLLNASRKPDGQPPAANPLAKASTSHPRVNELSNSESSRHGHTPTQQQGPLVSLNGKSISDEVKVERSTPSNGLPNSSGVEEKQEHDMNNTRFSEVTPSRPNGVHPGESQSPTIGPNVDVVSNSR